MKRTATFLLLVLGLFVCPFVKAQKPDLIYKTDSTIVRSYNVRVKGKVASYQAKPAKGSAVETIATQYIYKIVSANGRVEVFELSLLKQLYTPLAVSLPSVSGRSLPSELLQKNLSSAHYDRLLTSDWRIIECIIKNVSEKEILYVLANDENGKVLSIDRKLVRVSEKNTALDALPPTNDLSQQPAPGDMQTPSVPLKYSSITLGVEVSYILPILNPYWTSEKEEKGIRYTMGGTIQFTRRLGKIVSLTSELGYSQWQSDIFYLDRPDTLYSNSTIVKILPLKAGIQLYLGESLYIQPLAQLAFFQLSEKARNAGNTSEYRFVQNSLFFGGTISLGKIWRLSRSLIADTRLSYSILPKHLHTFSYDRIYSPIFNSLTFGVGIGYRSTK